MRLKVILFDVNGTLLDTHALQPEFKKIFGEDSGLRLATLTNSSERSQEQQLQSAGLTDYFEKTLSVDMVQRFKPDPKNYHAAARALDVQPGNILMVAAHGWDIFGAIKAGCPGAFVARPGQAIFPLGPQPDFAVGNLIELSDQIKTKRL